MSLLDQISNSMSTQLDRFFAPLRRRLFGTNNETLDFIMDSFYKLSPEQRLGALIALGFGGVGLVFGILFVYFSQISALERELNVSFNALHELRQKKKEFSREKAKFDQLISLVRSKTGKPIKPFFEQKAQENDVELQGLNDQSAAMLPENPLADEMQYLKVDVRLPKISIPRLLKYLTAIERSGNFLSVEDLDVRGRYGTKLYFDAQVKFRGYKVGGL